MPARLGGRDSRPFSVLRMSAICSLSSSHRPAASLRVKHLGPQKWEGCPRAHAQTHTHADLQAQACRHAGTQLGTHTHTRTQKSHTYGSRTGLESRANARLRPSLLLGNKVRHLDLKHVLSQARSLRKTCTPCKLLNTISQ